MNGRSGIFTFFLFLFLAFVVLLQVLSMVQADRLYERLNLLIDRWEATGATRVVREKVSSADLPGEEYPGDEGDWLVWHLSAEPHTLNPYTVEGDMYTRYITTGTIFERLFEYDKESEKVILKPWLAERMEISDGGLNVTVYLRDGIYFSDGAPVTADDVIFTFETIMNPGVDAADLRNYYHNVKEVVKIDERTVRFSFKELYWKTIESVGIFEVLPKHVYEFDDPQEFNTRRSNPFGSGPYVFEKWDVGQQIVLRRNENYWGYKPKLDKIVFHFITNDIAALQAIRSHDVDYMRPTPEQFAEMVKNDEFGKEFRTIKCWVPSVPYFFIGWNQERPFFKDRLVRLAMTHLVDRQSIIKHVLKGNAEISTGPFYLYGPQSDPNVKPWPFDPDKARELLDEAGWVDSDGDGIRDKDGLPLRFKYSYSTGRMIYEQVAKLLKDEAAKVGVEVIPDPYEWSVFVERLNNRKFDAATIGWGGTIESDPYQIFHSSQIEGRGNNFVSFRNAEADVIIEQARRTLDDGNRYALYHLFHRLLHEEQPYTFLFFRPEVRFLDKRFENVNMHKLGLYEFEWYVPKEKQRYK